MVFWNLIISGVKLSWISPVRVCFDWTSFKICWRSRQDAAQLTLKKLMGWESWSLRHIWDVLALAACDLALMPEGTSLDAIEPQQLRQILGHFVAKPFPWSVLPDVTAYEQGWGFWRTAEPHVYRYLQNIGSLSPPDGHATPSNSAQLRIDTPLTKKVRFYARGVHIDNVIFSKVHGLEWVWCCNAKGEPHWTLELFFRATFWASSISYFEADHSLWPFFRVKWSLVLSPMATFIPLYGLGTSSLRLNIALQYIRRNK